MPSSINLQCQFQPTARTSACPTFVTALDAAVKLPSAVLIFIATTTHADTGSILPSDCACSLAAVTAAAATAATFAAISFVVAAAALTAANAADVARALAAMVSPLGDARPSQK